VDADDIVEAGPLEGLFTLIFNYVFHNYVFPCAVDADDMVEAGPLEGLFTLIFNYVFHNYVFPCAVDADDMVAYLHRALSLYQSGTVLTVGQQNVFPGALQCNNNITVLNNASVYVACSAPKLLPKEVKATWPPT
jgi:hypothetical protein